MTDILATGLMMYSGGDGGSGGGVLALLLFAAGPAAGWGTWVWIQNRYRNRSARYRPDRTVAHHVSSLTGDDQPRGRYRSKSSTIDGRNDDSPDRRARNSQYFHGEIKAPEQPEVPENGDREGEAAPPPPPPAGPPVPPAPPA